MWHGGDPLRVMHSEPPVAVRRRTL